MTNKMETKDFRKIDAELDTCRTSKQEQIAISEQKKAVQGHYT
jgi:hypothetical protein